MKNNHFGKFNSNEKEKLNLVEKKYIKTRYCKKCGKELPFLCGNKKYHDECNPEKLKKKNWRI